MLNRYDGKCSLCKKPIPAGTEVRYDGETKQIQHWECWENPKPGPDAYRLADALNYRPYDEAVVTEWSKPKKRYLKLEAQWRRSL